MKIERLLPAVFIIACLANVSHLWALSGGVQEAELAAKEIGAARFSVDNIGAGEAKVVGRLSIGRNFLGTRATPAFADRIRFHSFDGTEVRLLTFADEEMKSNLMKQLLNGSGIPVIISADFDVRRVGHDGINMSRRIAAKIDSCEELSTETIKIAAATAGYKDETVQQFKTLLKPDASSNGVAVSLDGVFVRSKDSRRGSAVAFTNISIFNPLTDPATVKVKSLQIEQQGVVQAGTLKKGSGPESWEVEAESWCNGIYEAGVMPKIRWSFEPKKALEPKEEVSLTLELEINGETVTLKRTVEL